MALSAPVTTDCCRAELVKTRSGEMEWYECAGCGRVIPL